MKHERRKRWRTPFDRLMSAVSCLSPAGEFPRIFRRSVSPAGEIAANGKAGDVPQGAEKARQWHPAFPGGIAIVHVAVLLVAAALLACPLPAEAANSGGTTNGSWYVGIPKTRPASGGDVLIDSSLPQGVTNVYGGKDDNAPASFNKVRVTDKASAAEVYGGYSDHGPSEGNIIIFENSAVEIRYVVAGFSNDVVAKDNVLMISGGDIRDAVGGWSNKGVATGNKVEISGGEVAIAHAAFSVTGNVLNNRLVISGGEITDACGGHVREGSGSSSGNHVLVTGGKITGTLYGGFAGGTGNAVHNTVTISGSPDLSGATLTGGHVDNLGDKLTGNTLNVIGAHTVKNVSNFENYTFIIGADMPSDGSSLLTLTDTGDTDLSGARITVKAEGLAGNAPTPGVGHGFTLIRKENGVITDSTKPLGLENFTVRQGISRLVDFTVERTPNKDRIDAKVSSVRRNPQTKALSEGRLAGMALALHGADLAAERGMESAIRAADRAGASGPAGFYALSGGWLRHNTGSHVDMKSLSLLAGLAWGVDIAPGRLTAGAFLEFGHGFYETHNSFDNAASVNGEGNAWYMGGGALARLDFPETGPGRFHVEASGRMGGLSNDYHNNDLRDPWGRRAEYDSVSPYYGLHLGFGYVWNITDAASLDLYGRYFLTRLEGDGMDLPTGERLDFDAMDSSRLRVGGRFTRAVNEYMAPYIGAAWEHEFDGRARGTIKGDAISVPELKGDTGMGEIGLSLTPCAELPLAVDLGVRGYIGRREGITGSLQVKWTF